jgi:SAM-dependent MidA family methyltransferase
LVHDILPCIRERGPLTAAAFMELALYHPEHGYYTRSPYQPRAHGAGNADDATRLCGELLARQLARLAAALGPAGSPFTVIDAGAGDGRLAHALLRALHSFAPRLCAETHLHLIERSASARHAQRATLTAWSEHALGGDCLPDEFEGVVIARHLLSALPAHLLQRRDGTLREVHVDCRGDELVTAELPVSSPFLESQARESLSGDDSGQIAVSPAALEWMADTAGRLQRGAILVIDVGAGPATADRSGRCPIRSALPLESGEKRWTDAPGEHPLVADVDFAALERAAHGAGCTTARFVDQTSFLIGLAGSLVSDFTADERRTFTSMTRHDGAGSATRALLLVKNIDGFAGNPS